VVFDEEHLGVAHRAHAVVLRSSQGDLGRVNVVDRDLAVGARGTRYS
jgi:hypothetical protein